MSDLKVHIRKPGLHTTIQDKGRMGYQHLGVPFGGCMDVKSAKGANWLVGNAPDAALLEITLIGPEIVFHGSGQIALTGANLSPKINGEPIPVNQTLQIADGDLLTFGKCKYGCRSYLAIAGNWLVPQWLKSASAYNAQFTPKSILKKGDSIAVETTSAEFKTLSASQNMIFPGEVRVRMSRGPEFDSISEDVLDQLLDCDHSISVYANRMGYRLETKIKRYKAASELISSGIIPGTIQITNEGQPIILMKDAQTTGGYPRIGTIFSSDLNIVGQLKPGDKIWFDLK